MVPDCSHLALLLLSGSKSTGTSETHKEKLRVRHVSWGGRGDPRLPWWPCLEVAYFGNFSLWLHLLVLVNVVTSIQQTFIEHDYQAPGDIMINKAWFLPSRCWSPWRWFYKWYYIGMCAIVVLSPLPRPHWGVGSLKAEGFFLIYLFLIFVFIIYGVPKQEILVGLQERWTYLPQPLSIMTRTSPKGLPTHREARHPALGNKVEGGTLRCSHLLSTSEKSTFNLTLCFLGPDVRRRYNTWFSKLYKY